MKKLLFLLFASAAFNAGAQTYKCMETCVPWSQCSPDNSGAVIEKVDEQTYKLGDKTYKKLAGGDDEELYQSPSGEYMLINEKTGMARADFQAENRISVCYSEKYTPKTRPAAAASEIYRCQPNDDLSIQSAFDNIDAYKLFDREHMSDLKHFYANWGETLDGKFYYVAPYFIETDHHRLYIDKENQTASYSTEGDTTVCHLAK